MANGEQGGTGVDEPEGPCRSSAQPGRAAPIFHDFHIPTILPTASYLLPNNKNQKLLGDNFTAPGLLFRLYYKTKTPAPSLPPLSSQVTDVTRAYLEYY